MSSLICGRSALLVILIGMTAGCAAERDLPSPPPLVASEPSKDANSIYATTYVCDDGARLNVRFMNGPTLEDSRAVVSAGEGAPLVLPQKVAASGIWYATPRHELRGKGRDATWTADRRAAVQCRATE
ncbi:MliC family protein [Tistrella mobilis]